MNNRERNPGERTPINLVHRAMQIAATAWLLTASCIAMADNTVPPNIPDCQGAQCLPYTLKIVILIGMSVLLFVSLIIVIKSLRVQKWSLALALSEEASLPEGTPQPAAGQLPPMVPSSSRLIALFGTIILGTFFIGVGFYVIWQLCSGGRIDMANSAWAFFASGATLFIPYGVNKAASALN
ncbi:hypothetical protein [Paraburkholderia tagetis]|uniref:Uncharacterized protein n=1 Tax=Paraburkholderia tagetis TaxID=2913261 RepID=A0A9X1RMX6_9BURK|nr:hypothetical protein [Paraburkholderia tagetis]MCG5074070.1 hypothetical protein [Paraburkholderia tagetis]